jgi:hypothetical protein
MFVALWPRLSTAPMCLLRSDPICAALERRRRCGSHRMVATITSPRHVRHDRRRMTLGSETNMHVATPPGSGLSNDLRTQELPIYFFLHIQKTAGSTINAMLARMFKTNYIFHHEVANAIGGDKNFRSFLEKNPNFYDSIRLVLGHYGYNHPLVQSAPRRRIIMGILRDPVDRIVSLYDYMRYREDHPQNEALRKMNLLDATKEGTRFFNHCKNAQLRTLFGTENSNLAKKLIRERNYIVGKYHNLIEFIEAVEVVSKQKNRSKLLHLNSKSQPEGILSAKEQTDFPLALERLRMLNAEEILFFENLPPITVNCGAG